MTRKAGFTEQECELVLKGPPSAGTLAPAQLLTPPMKEG